MQEWKKTRKSHVCYSLVTRFLACFVWSKTAHLRSIPTLNHENFWYLRAHLSISTRRVQFWPWLWLGSCTDCAGWAFWWRCSGRGRLRKGAWWKLWRIKRQGIARLDTGTQEVAMLNLKHSIDRWSDAGKKWHIYTNRFNIETESILIDSIYHKFSFVLLLGALIILPNLFSSSFSCLHRPFNQISEAYWFSNEVAFLIL